MRPQGRATGIEYLNAECYGTYFIEHRSEHYEHPKILEAEVKKATEMLRAGKSPAEIDTALKIVPS